MSGSRRLEKQHALYTARNVKDSKVGVVMLKDNTHEDRLLQSRLIGLDRQRRRHQMHLDQARNQFVSLRVLPEPTIIVERPSTPFRYTAGGQAAPPRVKHYMTPLKSQQKPPSTLRTLDAFVCRRSRKTNTWHEAVQQMDKPHFINTVHPCVPLSKRELRDLEVGWMYHSPTGAERQRDLAGEPHPSYNPQPTQTDNAPPPPPTSATHAKQQQHADNTFITQSFSAMPKLMAEIAEQKLEPLSKRKSVTFKLNTDYAEVRQGKRARIREINKGLTMSA